MENPNKKPCDANRPYPTTEVERKNPRYARLLMQDYAGAKSELTAISQYTFQHLISGEESREVSDALACISRTEMHHFELLGELIVNFGGTPAFTGTTGRFWRGDYVNYTTGIRKFLNINIQAERDGIAAYERRIEQIEDKNARAVLRRIILDEREHIRVFEDLLEDY